jgi:hypothetical protein
MATLGLFDPPANGFGDEGATAVASAIKSLSALRTLDLRGIGATSASDSSENGFEREGATAIASAISVHSRLSDLDLRGERP